MAIVTKLTLRSQPFKCTPLAQEAPRLPHPPKVQAGKGDVVRAHATLPPCRRVDPQDGCGGACGSLAIQHARYLTPSIAAPSLHLVDPTCRGSQGSLCLLCLRYSRRTFDRVFRSGPLVHPQAHSPRNRQATHRGGCALSVSSWVSVSSSLLTLLACILRLDDPVAVRAHDVALRNFFSDRAEASSPCAFRVDVEALSRGIAMVEIHAGDVKGAAASFTRLVASLVDECQAAFSASLNRRAAQRWVFVRQTLIIVGAAGIEPALVGLRPSVQPLHQAPVYGARAVR
jgi:hypothetical protein